MDVRQCLELETPMSTERQEFWMEQVKVKYPQNSDDEASDELKTMVYENLKNIGFFQKGEWAQTITRILVIKAGVSKDVEQWLKWYGLLKDMGYDMTIIRQEMVTPRDSVITFDLMRSIFRNVRLGVYIEFGGELVCELLSYKDKWNSELGALTVNEKFEVALKYLCKDVTLHNLPFTTSAELIIYFDDRRDIVDIEDALQIVCIEKGYNVKPVQAMLEEFSRLGVVRHGLTDGIVEVGFHARNMARNYTSDYMTIIRKPSHRYDGLKYKMQKARNEATLDGCPNWIDAVRLKRTTATLRPMDLPVNYDHMFHCFNQLNPLDNRNGARKCYSIIGVDGTCAVCNLYCLLTIHLNVYLCQGCLLLMLRRYNKGLSVYGSNNKSSDHTTAIMDLLNKMRKFESMHWTFIGIKKLDLIQKYYVASAYIRLRRRKWTVPEVGDAIKTLGGPYTEVDMVFDPSVWDFTNDTLRVVTDADGYAIALDFSSFDSHSTKILEDIQRDYFDRKDDAD